MEPLIPPSDIRFSPPDSSTDGRHITVTSPQPLRRLKGPSYAAIIVENKTQRDRRPEPAAWTRYDVDLTGLSGAYAPEHPEPEFVDINSRNEAVVTLQENNHIAIVDLRRRMVIDDSPPGSVDLHGVDATEDGTIALTVPRLHVTFM